MIEKTKLSEIMKKHKEWLDSDGREGERASFFGADLRWNDFRGFDLRKVNFDYSDLRWSNLSNIDLRETDFEGAKFAHSDLSMTNLSGLDLSYDETGDIAPLDFSDCDMRGADFSESILCDVNFHSSNLGGVNFSNSDLSNAIMQHSDVRGTNFYNADLSGVDLRYVRFGNTRMQGADLTSACFLFSDIDNQSLEGAMVDGLKIKSVISVGPIGSNQDYFVIVETDADLFFSIGGIFSGNLKALENASLSKKYSHFNNVEYRAVIEMAKTIFRKE